MRKVNSQDVNFKKLLIQSLKETGFAVISNSGLDKEYLEEFQYDWRTFFEDHLSFKELYLYYMDGTKQHGYFPYRAEKAKDAKVADLKEFFQIYKEKDIPEFFRHRTVQIRDSLLGLSKKVLSAIGEDLDINLVELTENSDNTLFRVLYYPGLTDEEAIGGVRAVPHEDINFITLLPSASKPGLQLLDKNNEWIDIQADNGDVIVNIGDMLQMLSNSRYKSTTHRVVNTDNYKVPRISSPLFVHPKDNTNLGPMTSTEYLDQRLREIGLK